MNGKESEQSNHHLIAGETHPEQPEASHLIQRTREQRKANRINDRRGRYDVCQEELHKQTKLTGKQADRIERFRLFLCLQTLDPFSMLTCQNAVNPPKKTNRQPFPNTE